MSVFSQFFTTSSGATATIHYTQASKMTKAWARNNYTAIRYQDTNYAANGVTFHDAIGNMGASDDTNFGVDTYKTVANISGAGFCSAIIGPALLPTSNTIFLCNFNGGNGQTTATEENGKSLTFSGVAALSTSSPILGSASLAITGGSGYVTAPASVDYNFGSGDWAIIFRVKFNSVAASQNLVGQMSASNNTSWNVYWDNSGSLRFQNAQGSPATLEWTWSPSTATVYYVEVAKVSGTIRAFINGTALTISAGSASDANSWGTSTDALYIGREVARNNNLQADATFDTIKIIKGSGGNSSNYTPPAAEESLSFDSTTMRITVDGGTPEVITFNNLDGINPTYGTRAILGSPHTNDGTYGRVNSWRLTSDKTTVSAAGTAVNCYIADVPTSLEQNQPILRFESSLLVEMKTSAAVTGTTNQERRSGVIYKLD